MGFKIVIIEDDADIIRLARHNFENAGFEVAGFTRASEGLAHIAQRGADVIVLDVMLPDDDGFELCKRLRLDEKLRSVPLIFLTAKSSEIDRILGLEIGADDYIVKPFSPRELVARVKAVLRSQIRSTVEPDVVLACGLRLNPQTHEVFVRGSEARLSTLEFRLLHLLASHPGRVFTRERLLEEVWGSGHAAGPRTVDVHIRRIREKIELHPDHPSYLQTLRGAGYRFCSPSEC